MEKLNSSNDYVLLIIHIEKKLVISLENKKILLGIEGLEPSRFLKSTDFPLTQNFISVVLTCRMGLYLYSRLISSFQIVLFKRSIRTTME